MKRDKYGSPEILGGLSKLVSLGIIAAFLLFLVSYYMSVVNNSRREMARNFVNVFIPTALEYYKEDNGAYPLTEQGLEALWNTPTGTDPYILPAPLKDPWGNEYGYRCPGVENPDAYDIWSLGPDPADDYDDIRNWNSREGGRE